MISPFREASPPLPVVEPGLTKAEKRLIARIQFRTPTTYIGIVVVLVIRVGLPFGYDYYFGNREAALDRLPFVEAPTGIILVGLVIALEALHWLRPWLTARHARKVSAAADRLIAKVDSAPNG